MSQPKYLSNGEEWLYKYLFPQQPRKKPGDALLVYCPDSPRPEPKPKPKPAPPAVLSNSILRKEEEMERYLNLPAIDSDPLLFWRTRHAEFPNLAKLARCFLATPPSSVYSERAFSELGHIYGDLRTSLSSKRSAQLLFLHHNLRRIDLKKWMHISFSMLRALFSLFRELLFRTSEISFTALHEFLFPHFQFYFLLISFSYK